MIKERRKPRFIKAGARYSILRAQRYTISGKQPNVWVEIARGIADECEGKEWDMIADIRGSETDERREILHRYSIDTPSLVHRFDGVSMDYRCRIDGESMEYIWRKSEQSADNKRWQRGDKGKLMRGFPE